MPNLLIATVKDFDTKIHFRKLGHLLLGAVVGVVFFSTILSKPAHAELLAYEVTLSPTSGEGGTINFVYDDVAEGFTEFQITLPDLVGFEEISVSPAGEPFFLGGHPPHAGTIVAILTDPSNGDNLTLISDWFTEPIDLLIIGAAAGGPFNSFRCPLPRPIAVTGGYSYCTPDHTTNITGEGTFSAALVPTEVEVAIRIKPGSHPNTINLNSAGKTPVAILSSENFDVPTELDQSTITLAGAGVSLKGRSGFYDCHEEDVNGDELFDLLCQVETSDFQIEEGETSAVLEAMTFDGTPVRGEDTIIIVR